MNRTRKNNINKYTYDGNVYYRRGKFIGDYAAQECRARGARVLMYVYVAVHLLHQYRYRWFQFPAKGLNGR